MPVMKPRHLLTLTLFILTWLQTIVSYAETIHLINGDQIKARVISLDENHLSIQSEILGLLSIPRTKVARIDFIIQTHASNAASPQDRLLAPNSHRAPGKLNMPGALNGAGSTNLIQQVQQQMLTTAGPEANEMYQDLVQGVVSGQINVPQLKTMAEDTVQQIEELQAELGDDVGFALDGYLSILKGFIQKAEKNN